MITVNLSTWTTMQPILTWQRAAEIGDFAMLNRLMAQVITAWDYPQAPSDETSYASLSPDQWAECVKEVSAAIGAMFRR